MAQNFSKQLDQFGREYIKTLEDFLLREGKKASGNLINSLDYRIVQNGDNAIRVVIQSNDYLEWVDKGRRPGSYPPISAISKWATIKGIPQSAVFPIAHKIYKFGIKPTNVIAKTNNKILDNATRKLERVIANSIETYVVNELFNKEGQVTIKSLSQI
jgi:hypothetical protein